MLLLFSKLTSASLGYLATLVPNILVSLGSSFEALFQLSIWVGSIQRNLPEALCFAIVAVNVGLDLTMRIATACAHGL